MAGNPQNQQPNNPNRPKCDLEQENDRMSAHESDKAIERVLDVMFRVHQWVASKGSTQWPSSENSNECADDNAGGQICCDCSRQQSCKVVGIHLTRRSSATAGGGE